MNRKIVSIAFILCCTLTIAVCSTNKEIETNADTNWEQIKSAIANCEVDTVFQAHSLDVSVYLKNGETLTGVEPGIDDILGLAENAKEKCGDIAMATE